MSLGPEKASKHQQLLICTLTLNGDNCRHYYFYYTSTVLLNVPSAKPSISKTLLAFSLPCKPGKCHLADYNYEKEILGI